MLNLSRILIILLLGVFSCTKYIAIEVDNHCIAPIIKECRPYPKDGTIKEQLTSIAKCLETKNLNIKELVGYNKCLEGIIKSSKGEKDVE